MSVWQISEIKSALKKQIITINKENEAVDIVVIDSRTRIKNGLFIALKGINNDGHNFLHQAFANGCNLAIVEKIPQEFSGDNRLILVENCLLALELLATFSRSRTAAKIIAVTGSAGKTGVKEMLNLVFKTQGKTFCNSGNLNNQFGLPLSLANMPIDAEFAIFEMGMNHLGEIAYLSKIAQPHIAIITNIFNAHLGNFRNEEEIALAKSEIFLGLCPKGFAIINSDNKYFDFLKNQALLANVSNNHVISFGSKEISDVRILAIEKAKGFSSKVNLFITKSNKKINYTINTINQTIIFNSLIPVSCLEIIGNDFEKGLQALEHLEVTRGRGNIINVEKAGIKFTIIDDSYNANPSSMQAGLKFLVDLKIYQQNARTIAFIGDMLELGDFAVQEHIKLTDHLHNVDKVFLVGQIMQNLTSYIAPDKIIGHISKSSSFKISDFQPENNDIIFIKGSRGIKMENIMEILLLDNHVI